MASKPNSQNRSGKSSVKNEDGNSQITDFFTKNKNLKPSQSTSTLCNNSIESCDIYENALKRQLTPSQSQPTKEESVVTEKLLDTIAKLEAMLLDERKAKEKLIADHNVLKEKYISTLQLMVKTQSLLLKHKRYMESSAAGNEAVSIGPKGDSTSLQKTSDSEEMLSLNVEEYLQAANEDIQVEVISDISHDNILKLNSIQPDKTHDSTFITNVLEILYVDKQELQCRSITGRSRTEGVKKQPITPEKMEIITSLFTKRIKNCGANNEEKVLRLAKSNINRLIGQSISNVNNKTMKSQR